MNTLENNKLIAEFMESPMDQRGGEREPFYIAEDINVNVNVHKMQFHSSWDWLMPVVHKIVADFEFNQDNELIDNEYREVLMDIVPFGVIADTYQAVVEFIKWYNKNS